MPFDTVIERVLVFAVASTSTKQFDYNLTMPNCTFSAYLLLKFTLHHGCRRSRGGEGMERRN